MDRQDLKEYKFTKEWIKDRQLYFKEQKATLENISGILATMPRRQ